jgi:beta-galactosidase
MYPDVAYVVNQGKSDSKKPFFLCEYAHAMGNAVGNLQEYMDAFESSPRNMGGCIWDFIDQSLRKTLPDGTWFYAYGGDYDDYPNDGPFCNNGLIMPDRQATPKIWEVKKVYQPIKITPENLSAGEIMIRNRHFFTNLSEYAFDWFVAEDGRVIAHGKLDGIELAPGKERRIMLPLPNSSPEPGAERFLRVSLKLRADTAWAAAGHEIAWEQMKLPIQSPAKAAEIAGRLTTEDSATEIRLEGNGFSVAFDKESATMSSYKVGGREVLARNIQRPGPVLNIFRAFTDNDTWFQKRFWESGLGTLKHTPAKVQWKSLNDRAVRVTIDMRVRGFKGTGFDHKAIYTILADGSMSIDNDFVPFGKLPPLPKLGLILTVDDAMDHFAWFGRGPMESYPDRKTAVDIGLYKGKVADQYQEYVRPQENGNKEDVRWAALTDANGVGVMFQAPSSMATTVSRFRPEDVDDARHENGEPRKCNKLVPRPNVTVCLDAEQMGLGGASCGPGPLEEYICSPGGRSFRVVMRPLRPGDDVRRVGRIGFPVAGPPVVLRGDDGLLMVLGDPGTVVEIDGVRQVGQYPQQFSKGGTVRAFVDGDFPGIERIEVFEPIVPVRQLDIQRAEADSFQPGEGEPAHAFDFNSSTYWHTEYGSREPKHPHFLTAGFARPETVIGFEYKGRIGNANGRIAKYEIQVSKDGKTFERVHAGDLRNSSDRQRVMFKEAVQGVIAIKFVALSEINGNPWASIAGLTYLAPMD